MSVQKINVLVLPAHRLAPGAAWIADAVASVMASALVQIAAWRRRSVEENRVRERIREQSRLQSMALRYMATQPSFAKDLLWASTNDRGD